MDQLIDEHLERMAELGQADRRNGCYTRWLPAELDMPLAYGGDGVSFRVMNVPAHTGTLADLITFATA